MTKSTITREQITSWMNDANYTLEEPLNADDAAAARAILAMGHELLAAMDSEPAIADCDPEVYEKGVSVCLVAIPKETAEVICQNITAATGCKVDWHYFGGRVHIKALRVTSQPAPVVNGEYGDAYQGAREDLAIWKRRALEAEESVRRLEQINDHLVKEAQGESRMGEPVIAQPVADSEPDRNPVLAYADSYRDMAKQGVESVPIWSVITDLERNIAPLYRHAQPVPVVPEEKSIPNTLSMYAVDAVAAIAEVKGWNACRAAMLAAAPQLPGSDPATVPGKWIPVSERMPEDRTQVILWDAEIGEVTSGHYSHKTQTFYHCGDAIENEITHWMLPPSAPQGVKP